MKYTIKDLYSIPDSVQYLSEQTTSLEDLWFVQHYKQNENPVLRAKVFTDLQEAKRWLKEVKMYAAADWRDNAEVYSQFGRSKPNFEIYTEA
jgi:hypothetical protein